MFAEAALWFARAPDLLLRLITFYFLGVASEAATVLFIGIDGYYTDYIIFGIVVLVVQTAYIAGMQRWVVKRRGLILYLQKDYLKEIQRSSSLQQQQGISEPVKITFRPLFESSIRFWFPETFWWGDSVLSRCFGEWFSSFKDRWVYRVASVRLGAAFVMSIIVRARWTSVAQCQYALTSIASIFFVLALFYLLCRPYRRPTSNAFAFFMNVIAGLIPLGRAYPSWYDYHVLMLPLIIIALVAAAFEGFITIIEFVTRNQLRRAFDSAAGEKLS